MSRMRYRLILEDRMKVYELAECSRKLMPLLPIMARIDGKCFHAFTSDLNRPYDESLSQCMINTTKFLIEETQALAGYTQSDEISLCWYEPDYKSQTIFNRRIQKLVSILAAMTTMEFSREVGRKHWGKGDHLGQSARIQQLLDRRPIFDARVWNVPSLEEAANVFLWRNYDSTKNAISMAARHYFSHSRLQNKNGKEMQEMLWQEHNINFNDYPAFFKRGTFIQRRKVFRKFDITKDDLPEKHEARRNPDLLIERSEVCVVDMPPFAKVANRVGVIFYGEDPVVTETNEV